MTASFGTIRALASGRFQARFTDTEGKQRSCGTHATEKAARAALTLKEADLLRGVYRDETPGQATFAEAAADFMRNKADIAPGTRRNYVCLLNKQLLPVFGTMPLSAITKRHVRIWWVDRESRPVNRRNGFFLLKQILDVAVEDDAISANPCKTLAIKEPGKDVARRRPTYSYSDFLSVLSRVPTHYRLPLHVLFGAHLRVGELAGLNRGDFNAKDGTLTVERQLSTVGKTHLAQTKTGNHKTVGLPANTVRDLKRYLARHPALPDAPLLPGPKGGRLHVGTLRKHWIAATEAIGLEGMHLHDARHIGLTLVARTGATTKDIQHRGGHSSVGAAMRYQHTTRDQDLRVTEGLTALMA